MRRRYVQIDGELVEVDRAGRALPVDSGALWGDRGYAGLRATDGTPIDSRTKHREYMRMHGLTTADDFTDEWRAAAARREAFYRRAADPERPGEIAHAIVRLERR